MKKSKILIISAILGTLYALYLVSHFGSGVLNSNSGAETLGAGMATMIVLPHMLTASLGAVFSVIAVVTYKQWAAMTAFILYFVASALFPIYAMFTIPIGILATIGWIKVKKANTEEVV